MLKLIKKIFAASQAVNFKQLTQNGAVVIDVRTAEEFKTGHVNNAVNIPLDSIGRQLLIIKKMNKPVIAVCRSGNRSGMAVKILKNIGVEAYNGGAWNSLKNKIA
jgi:phage shock protein E